MTSPFDIFLVVIFFALTFAGMYNGILRDGLQTLMWILVSVISGWMLAESVDMNISEQVMQNPAIIGDMIKNMAISLGVGYAAAWILDKMVLKPVFKRLYAFKDPSTLSRTLGGLFGAAKLPLLLMLGGFALHTMSESKDPVLPNMLEQSRAVQWGKDIGWQVYDYATDEGWVEYRKVDDSVADSRTLSEWTKDIMNGVIGEAFKDGSFVEGLELEKTMRDISSDLPTLPQKQPGQQTPNMMDALEKYKSGSQ